MSPVWLPCQPAVQHWWPETALLPAEHYTCAVFAHARSLIPRPLGLPILAHSSLPSLASLALKLLTAPALHTCTKIVRTCLCVCLCYTSDCQTTAPASSYAADSPAPPCAHNACAPCAIYCADNCVTVKHDTPGARPTLLIYSAACHVYNYWEIVPPAGQQFLGASLTSCTWFMAAVKDAAGAIVKVCLANPPVLQKSYACQQAMTAAYAK